MTLYEWKQKYLNADMYYDAYFSSEEGQKLWSLAHTTIQNELSEDSLINAFNMLLDGLEIWLINNVPQDEKNAAAQWFQSFVDILGERVFADLE